MSGISVSISVKLSKKLRVRIDDDAIADWIDDRLNDARNSFIEHMTEGGSGRTYGGHVASAPGEYPQSWSGHLANSVQPELHGSRAGSLTSDAQYAVYLTTGTTKMDPRLMFADVLEEVIEARPRRDKLADAVKIDEARAD